MQDDGPWTFARFVPGAVFGTIALPMDDARRRNWEAIYGARSGEALPRGMLVAAMMEAYIRAIQPRPDGNVHASQKLAFGQARGRWGDMVRVTVSCAGKQEKKGRFWVDFAISAVVAGEPVLTGTITSIWAA